MRPANNQPRPGGDPGHRRMADVRAEDGSLLAVVDQDQAGELLHRRLIEPLGRRHYRATDEQAVKLWARSRSRTRSGQTTVGVQRGAQVHRALKRMLL